MKRSNNLKFFKRKKAYSLIEILVSLSIIGFSMILLVNFLVIGLKIEVASLNRSFVREELSNISTLITRDLRNASTINNCNSNSCNIILDNGTNITWQMCINNTSICKTLTSVGNNQNLITSTGYTSPSTLKITNFDFSNGFSDNNSSNQRNVILTIIASHSNSNLSINNLIRQTSITLRNF